jgi:hypothetical protein
VPNGELGLTSILGPNAVHAHQIIRLSGEDDEAARRAFDGPGA